MAEPALDDFVEAFADEAPWYDEPAEESAPASLPGAGVPPERYGAALADGVPLPADEQAALLVEVNREYPYNPRLHIAMQVDLDKLRTFKDRKMAAMLLGLWRAMHPRWASEEFKQERAREAEKKRAAEHARLDKLANDALAKRYGEAAEQLAKAVLYDEWHKRRTDEPALREFERELRKLRRAGR